ncbi:MAG: PEP-CTERM sorting domain-containing protein [Phycisphaerales bacterium]
MDAGNRTAKMILAAGGLALTVGQANAQFTDNFEDGLGASRYNIATDYESGVADNNINFTFDYIAAGLPLAPNSTGGDTLGLYVQSNLTDQCPGLPGCNANNDEGEMIAFYPGSGNSFGPNDDYILQFDFYQNVKNVGNIFSMTESVSMGLNANGTDANWFFGQHPTSGSWFSMTTDGDSSTDIRAFEGDAVDDGSPNGYNFRREYAEDDNVDPLLQGVAGFLDGSLSAANPVTLQAISSGWSVFQLEKSGTTITWRVNGNPEVDNVFETLFTFDQSAPIVPAIESGFDITQDSGSNFSSGQTWFGYGDFVNSVMDAGELGGIFDNIKIIVNSVNIDGDLDGDGFVGITDLNIVLSNWNQNVTPGDPLVGDPTGDGFVGIDDLNQVLSNWNAGTPPAANAVPEPATLALLGLGGLAMIRRK